MDESPRRNDERILEKLDRHGEVLTRLDTKMESLIGNGGTKGRIPDIERDVKDHSTRINSFDGSVRTIIWVITAIGGLLLSMGAVFVAHLLGGK